MQMSEEVFCDTVLAFIISKDHMWKLRRRTVVGKRTETNQCDRLNENRGRSSVHGKGSRRNIRTHESYNALVVTTSAIRSCAESAGASGSEWVHAWLRSVGEQYALFSRELLEQYWQEKTCITLSNPPDSIVVKVEL